MKMNRRAALKTMGLGAGMLAFPELLLADVKPAVKVKAKSVIQVFFWGGLSHIDSFDPKPDAGYDITGQFKDTVKTKTDGLLFNALLPKMAAQSDKFSVIHSMTHGLNGHEQAAYAMQTGHAPGERLSYPSIGAVWAYFRQNPKALLPPYVVLTQLQGRFSESGFLPQQFKPYATGSDPNASRFEAEGIISRGISDERQIERKKFLEKMNTLGNQMHASPEVKLAEECKEKAYELILGQGKDVFDLTKEKPELRDKYGRNTLGQDCLAARRLVEAGCPYVTVNAPGGYDHHANIFPTLTRMLPLLDAALATLFEDLSDRGLLDSTLVWCCGEFGRGAVDWEPPWGGGRNHHGAVNSVVLGGGGLKGGKVVGSSDAKGDLPKDRPVWPVDLLGTLYTAGGIPVDGKLPHPLGFEAKVLPMGEEGIKSAGLLTELM